MAARWEQDAARAASYLNPIWRCITLNAQKRSALGWGASRWAQRAFDQYAVIQFSPLAWGWSSSSRMPHCSCLADICCALMVIGRRAPFDQ